VPAMVLTAGSVVAVKDRPKSRELARKSLEAAEGREMSPWLALDPKNFSGTLVRMPTREEIAPIVNEQLIVELYSK